MIRASVPLRLPVAGGGTDLPEFFSINGAELLTVTIDQRINIEMTSRKDDSCLVTELQGDVVHPVSATHTSGLVDCVFRRMYHQGINIKVESKISAGAGLGGSGSLTVVLVAAFDALNGGSMSLKEIATTAYDIERNDFGAPVGLQDHFAAAFGGFIRLKITSAGDVEVIEEPDLFVRFKAMLKDHGLLFDTRTRRSAKKVLQGVSSDLIAHSSTAFQGFATISGLLGRIEKAIQNGIASEFGEALHEHWMHKRTLHGQMSSEHIDMIYEEAMKSGAYGGKLIGAGGGGYLLLFCPKELRGTLIEKLQTLGINYQPFDLDACGLCLTRKAKE